MTLVFWLCKTVQIIRHRLRKWFFRRLGSHIGQNVRLYGGIDGVNPRQITIDDNTVIGKAAQLITHCPVRGNAPVRIGANCYIGYGAIVLPGVTIGDNCIVGAGSVVTHNIPPNTISAGNPARILRRRDPEELTCTTQKIESGQPVGTIPDDIQQCHYLLPGNYCLKTEGRPCVALQGKFCGWLAKVVRPLAPYGYIERRDNP